MKKLVLTGFIFCLICSRVEGADDWDWQDISGGNRNFNVVLTSRNDPKVIFTGTKDVLLKSEDGAQNWSCVSPGMGKYKSVNFLLFDPLDNKSLYAATANGLFVSQTQGRSWKRIFKGKNYLENQCTVIQISPFAMYLGTKYGLFISRDKGRTWNKQSGRLGNRHILAIVIQQEINLNIYVACADAVFKTTDELGQWSRIFTLQPAEISDAESQEEINPDEEQQRLNDIKYIAAVKSLPGRVYLAASQGIYESLDGGLGWNLLSTYGLLDRQVSYLFFSPDSTLYAAAKSGLFKFDCGRWHELPSGMSCGRVNSADFDNQGNLYVASENGLFKLKGIIPEKNNNRDQILRYSKNEPEINSVWQAAIHYAEVDPEKIALWRKQAAKKAYLPKVSAGINRDTSDLWHWESGSSTKSGDDYLVRGRQTVGWDVTLSWDLAEIIWNNDQTAIDARSRLTVELREDILDQVTKLYFERLRVKMELDNLGFDEKKKRFEKELRLRELTASLDAFTNGYFSRESGPDPVM